MTPSTDVDAVMRTLADPTRRAVFERIVKSEEITVAAADAGQRRDAIRHLAASAVVEAGRPDRRSTGGPQCSLSRRPQGARAARQLDVALRRLLARALCQSQNIVEGDRLMTQAAMKTATQHIVVEEVLPHAPENDLESADDGRTDRPLAYDADDRVRSREGQALHLSDDAGRRVGWRHPMPGVGGDADGTPRLFLERRTREEMSATAHRWTPSLRGPSPRSRAERVFAWSIPASCCRRTTMLSKI